MSERACAIVGCELWPNDPLLAAMIWKLPRAGTSFPAIARTKWLEMMAMAFDVAYGAESGDVPRSTADTAAPAAPAAEPKREPPPPHMQRGCDFYVDRDGFARSDYQQDEHARSVPSPGRRVTALEAEGTEIYDYRGAARDRSTVVWADDTVGALPGMNFCGPG